MDVKRVLMVSVFCILRPRAIYSQWTAEDSLWLKDVLSDKKELHLKPEVSESIRLGNFLNPERKSFEIKPWSPPI